MSINDGLLWALSDQAKTELEELERRGVSRDLAFAILETLVPEKALYCIEKDETHE